MDEPALRICEEQCSIHPEPMTRFETVNAEAGEVADKVPLVGQLN